MNYFIDIIDTTTGDLVLIQEHASRSGLTLEWQGSDAKDELFLVGSSLSFDMAAPNLSMGHFLHLFTGDEQKFRVEFRKEQTGAVGPELLTNPDFAAGIYKWRSLTLSRLTIQDNKLRIHVGPLTDPKVSQAITTEVGKEYTVSINTGSLYQSDSFELRVGEDPKGSELLHITGIAENSTATGTFVATAASTEIGIVVNTTGLFPYGLVESLSVKEVLEDNGLLWQGFLLPDSYEEPYTNGIPFIAVTAVDGLGRLKGKYLPDDFYTKEISVIETIQACLEQTGLVMPLYFSAAIQHISFKKYHSIFIDGTLLFDGTKKLSCYKVLTDLLESMLCLVYQSYGNWYVEGLNVRHLATVVYDKYDFNGTYVGEIETARIIKTVDKKTLVTPTVSMVPVYKSVNVDYVIEDPYLPTSVTQVENTGWAAQANDYVYSSAFYPHGGDSFAIATGFTEYRVRLNKAFIAAIDLSRYVSLINPVYVNIGQEILVEIDFATTINTPTDNTSLKVEVLLNAVVIYTVNLFYDPSIEEEDDKKLTLLKEVFIMSESGYLDVIFYQPISDGNGSAGTDGWEFTKFKISIANQPDEYSITDQVNGNFSLEKDVELTYVDEFSAKNKVLLLEKVDANFSSSYDHNITVLKSWEVDGKYYMQVYLRDAKLCDDFKYNLTIAGSEVTVLGVFYNWLGVINEYVVQLESPVNGGAVVMVLEKGPAANFDRSTWQSWTDAVYKVENNRYGKAVANVYRRMFLEPYEKIDCTVKHMLTFNDLVLFKYQALRRYVPVNLSVNLDEGESSVSMVLNYYHDNSGGVSTNISPILTVMDDAIIPVDFSVFNLTGSAYDPDGFIASFTWEVVQGGAGILVVEKPLTEAGDVNATVYLLPLDEDEFIFRCTVTDNGGASVSKDVNVSRVLSTELTTTDTCGDVMTHNWVPRSYVGELNPKNDTYAKAVRLDFLDNVSTIYNFNIRITAEVLLCSVMAMESVFEDTCDFIYGYSADFYRVAGAGFKVYKNKQRVGNMVAMYFDVYGNLQSTTTSPDFVDVIMNSSDEIYVVVHGYKNDNGYGNAKVKIESITEINNAVEVTNEGLEFYLTTNYTLV